MIATTVWEIKGKQYWEINCEVKRTCRLVVKILPQIKSIKTNIQRKSADNRKRSDRNTSHIKLLNKCNVAEEDDDNCQLEIEKIEWVKKKYIWRDTLWSFNINMVLKVAFGSNSHYL